MIVGVPSETLPGEKRVALTPESVSILKDRMRIVVQTGAGSAAGFSDEAFVAAGADIVSLREEVFSAADVVLQVRTYGANKTDDVDLQLLKTDQVVLGFAEPLEAHNRIEQVAKTGASLFAVELMPRITRAQSMDALSSMATIAGYKSVLMAASKLPRMFPLMMTAAGTVAPARVLVIGVGVAGLQAIATAKRLGAVILGYDVRPAVREQVESLGAEFVDLGLETDDAETTGGYAKEQEAEFYRRQQSALSEVIATCNVVITTAAIPGQRAPVLIPTQAVAAMAPHSIILDLAAERGGNCELTQVGEEVEYQGVKIFGPANLPSSVPYHASQMYSNNLAAFLVHLLDEKNQFQIDNDDEITSGTLVTHRGKIVNSNVLAAMSQTITVEPTKTSAEPTKEG
tara:strand:+ start:947 stop:2146 length:1200 start_codon:yes stop_codon:yes gene_type:complete